MRDNKPDPEDVLPVRSPWDAFAGVVVVVTSPGGSSGVADGVTGPAEPGSPAYGVPAEVGARRRQHLVGLLARADELVLLAGDAPDLTGVAEVLLLLRQCRVLLVQRGQLCLGVGEVGPLVEERAGREPGEEHDGGHDDGPEEDQPRPCG